MSATNARSLARLLPFALILALFFLSGASGLVYQVIWVRLLTRVFGATTFAVSALLAAFMGGLGLGSALASRHLHRVGSPLRWFGALEIGVGLYALALNWLLPLGEGVFLGLVSSLELSRGSENLLKLVLSFVVLLPPTTFMGASLPLLVRQFVDRLGTVGLRTGSLYAINTLGAAAGCFAAGFYTIPFWGMEQTTQFAAAVNASVGLAAIGLSLWLTSPVGEEEDVEPGAPEATAASAPEATAASAMGWAVAAFTVSGFAALGLEVVWTRLITLVFKGYTYSFTAMLTVFLIGIALGSIAFARVADRSRDRLALLGAIQIGIGVSVLALTALLVLTGPARIFLHYELGYDWQGQTLSMFVIAFAILGLPTFLFGAQFPVVARVATDAAPAAGKRVGSLYALNVVGSIFGSLATGYVLIPLVGTQASLYLLAGSMVVMGTALVSRASALQRRSKRWAVALAAGLTVLAVALTPPDLSRWIHEDWLRAEEVIAHYEEGATATVMVASYPGRRDAKRILVNGSSASNSSAYGLSVNRVQGSIPFLFERMPKRVLAVCFGTGITFGTLSQFDVEHIDGVDISPEVIRAAHQFEAENYDVVHDERVTLHIDDGRNFLLKSPGRYDVITMEPMPPALAGVSDMYTAEFYELVKSHLSPGGIMSQWVPLYYLTFDDVRMLYRTFGEAFPHAMVFFYNYDTFLVGSDEPLELSPNAFRERLVSRRLKQDLARIDLASPEQMYSSFLMGREAMLELAGDAPVVTDDRPLVEFTGPKAVDLGTTPTNYLTVTGFAEPVMPALRGADVSKELLDELERRFEEQTDRWRSARRQHERRRPPHLVN